VSQDYARIARLNTSQQIPSPNMVPVVSFTVAWVAGSITTNTYYFRATALRASQNATPLWEGETLASDEQTLAGAASKDRARLVVTMDGDADGFRIYQHLHVAAGGLPEVHLWAEVRVTRDANGDITSAALQAPYNIGTVVGTTASTVTWDSPSGASGSASASNPVVPTVETAHVTYLVLSDPLFVDGGGMNRKTIDQELCDGSNASNLRGHVPELDLRVESTSADSAADIRTLLGWGYIRLWLLPDTYPAVAWDGFFAGGMMEQFLSAWDTGPRLWPLKFRGSKAYGTPPALVIG